MMALRGSTAAAWFFLAAVRDFGGFGVHGHLALQAALAVMPAIQTCCGFQVPHTWVLHPSLL